ncbi:restriction endonuclease subunit S [Subsaximicrobium wynnwilliamsii]|uniref:Restriction endonuclease subunit S n=1 Tax=Subsaximicrobium wynnwilliamsii TaxID=291179 RepID=A0A5C6ZG19_9FLAO|nr:restriction endonuclease subunit S [Subsaximicrobium wynnwilliamsii]TXD83112.1 restriction endonuclease subunit S [Subsaximicrobium wynnwilliamsii]TXD88856.1 restriction endonuclease subunit S [Subsaximicrobium wynnwilliamsii]TXE02929.1 restriction endonuclease subunit S [Subsaximicrobium wynnwilliamsii]
MEAVVERTKRYENYKNSGVEWLGEIPEHWEVRRIKYLFNEINERSENGSEDLLSVSQYTGVTNKTDKVEDGGMLTNALTLEGYKKVQKGDLVSNIMLAWNGSLGFSPFDGITSPAYSIYRLYDGNVKRYFHYLLRTELYKAEYKRNSSGVIESRLRLYTDDFFNILSILPPLEEQTAIAEFLDDKTTKIDQAIAIKQQQITLLKERKQILIHKAVTRGLDDTVALKDSGVEWIGEIPEGWEAKALKYFCFITKLTGFEYTNVWKTDSEGQIIALRGFNIQSGELDLSETEAISEKLSNSLQRTKLYKNDIVYPCTGTIGNAALIKEDNKFHINQNIARICLQSKEMFPEYFLKSLLSYATKSQIDFNNSSQMQPVILIGSLRNIKISFPPLLEQKKISDYIETASQKFETAICLKQQEISTLKEYKGSLINSVVTGKVKVC